MQTNRNGLFIYFFELIKLKQEAKCSIQNVTTENFKSKDRINAQVKLLNQWQMPALAVFVIREGNI